MAGAGGGVPGAGGWCAALGRPGVAPTGPGLGLLGAGGERAALRAAEAELRARREETKNPAKCAPVLGLLRPALPEVEEEEDDEVLEQEDLVGDDLEL